MKSRGVATCLVPPDVLDGGLVGIKREGLRAELDGRVGGQQHEGHIEEHVIHERGPNSHGPHREQQQHQPHLGASLYRHSCVHHTYTAVASPAALAH